MLALNQSLSALPDDTRIPSIELAHVTGIQRHIGDAWVYWPFVLHRTMKNEYDVSHAATGCWVYSTTTKRDAVKTIRRLRIAADFNFISPRSRKAQRAKRATSHIIAPLRRIG